MAITTLDGYLASGKQFLNYVKTTTRTTVAGIYTTLFDIAGNPGAGTLSAGNTANGVVPTDAVAGFPVISAFSGSNKGYITRVNMNSTVVGAITLYDKLFHCGAYAFNANTTLASQPSYSARVPGTIYTGLELWVEAVTAFTGTPSFQINYLDQDGNAGDTGAISAGAALIIGRCFQMPLASGDTGIQQIVQVRGTVASAGTFNVMVLRRLWSGYIATTNIGIADDLLKTGMPEVFADSALYPLVRPNGTSSGVPYMSIEIANG